MSRVPLIFMRHGETDWNRQLRFQGQRDIPMNERGRRQAARNGRALAGILATGEWRLVTSPLQRSVESMRIALEAAGQGGRNFETDPALVEAHYGDWEGLTLIEIETHRALEAEARQRDKWGFRPPNGESYAMLSNRVAAWLKTVHAPTFVVAHGGILRALLHQLGGLPAHDAPHLIVPQDRVILFTRASIYAI
jgi:probable phosphoglycerate mutase